MREFEAKYDKHQVKRYCMVLGGLAIFILIVAIMIFFLWKNDYRLLVPMCILGIGMLVISIVFHFRMGRDNIAFYFENDKLYIKGIGYTISDITKVDGVLNLGKENSKSYLDEFCVSAPDRDNLRSGDIYITIKDKQQKFSYIADLVGIFEYFSKLQVQSSLVVWVGNSNRKYTYFENND